MFEMIESLEGRMLMSVTADTLTADAQAVRVDTAAVIAARNSFNKTVQADVAAIVTGVRKAQTPQNRAENNTLLSALQRDSLFYRAKISAGVNGLLASSRYSAAFGAAYGKVLLKHPTSAPYQKFVAKVVTYANGVVPEWVTNVENELTNLFNRVASEVGLLASLNPTVSNAVNTFENDLENQGSTLATAAMQVQTDTSQLTSDLGAIPTS